MRRLEKIREAGDRCQACDSPSSLVVHHRSYDRRGSELWMDLIVLCSPCHELIEAVRFRTGNHPPRGEGARPAPPRAAKREPRPLLDDTPSVLTDLQPEIFPAHPRHRRRSDYASSSSTSLMAFATSDPGEPFRGDACGSAPAGVDHVPGPERSFGATPIASRPNHTLGSPRACAADRGCTRASNRRTRRGAPAAPRDGRDEWRPCRGHRRVRVLRYQGTEVPHGTRSITDQGSRGHEGEGPLRRADGGAQAGRAR